MVRVFEGWLGIVAVFILAMSQVLGLYRGYLCGCLGVEALVDSPECLAEHCHPGAAHGDGCVDQPAESTSGDRDAPNGHDPHDGDVPDHPHKHVEVREWIDLAMGGGLLSLPPPILIDVRECADLTAIGSISTRECVLAVLPSRLERGPPPMSLVVAKSVVRLV